MAEYKCIMCDEIDENKKIHNCPVCGYRMFPIPYDKKAVLCDDIRSYIMQLCKLTFKSDYLEFIRTETDEDTTETITLDEDKSRFPSFTKIYRYVVSAKKTEEFLERLEVSSNRIREYIQMPFQAEYTVVTTEVENQKNRQSIKIVETLDKISTEALVEEIKFPEITLYYSEIVDEKFQPHISELLDLIEKLIEKIKQFIKRNHVFGAFYTKNNPDRYEVDNKNAIEKLLKQQILIKETLEKKYIIDILSDGSDEVCEMLDVLWMSIAMLRNLPVLQSNYYFRSAEFECNEMTKLIDYLAKISENGYRDVIKVICDNNFLSEYDEKSLFKLYNDIIKSDTLGYFGIDPSMLLSIGEYEEKLNELIGLDSVKSSIQKIKAYSMANKGKSNLNLHMCFYGNPGTGKTEVARIIAGILYENDILPTNRVVETDPSGLVAGYVGQTALKTQEKIQEAMGGVLFIDEAYSLIQSESKTDYGHEAVSTLIKAMEDYRGKLCVIFAGYHNKMKEMIASNPGFLSRIQFGRVDFHLTVKAPHRSVRAPFTHTAPHSNIHLSE